MLDSKFIKNNLNLIQQMLSLRCGYDSSLLNKFIELDTERKEIISYLEFYRNKRNVISKKIYENNEEIYTIKNHIKSYEESLSLVEEKLFYIQKTIPNMIHESIPFGTDENNNIEIRKFGIPKKFNFEPKSHYEIGEKLNILDFERGTKLSGSRFVIYKGAAARLERALINFMLDIHTQEHQYLEHITPFLVKKEICEGTGQLPKFEDDMYKTNDDMFLISTSEIILSNIHREEVLEEKDLPKYYTAYSPCFRKEAGNYGRDMKGLIRQHQFNKVEMVKFTTPDSSYEELEKMVLNAETILQKLELPYRTMLLCSGEIGFSSSKTYDIEVWIPSQNKYREISSCSNCTDFQSRRMNIKYKSRKTGKNEYVHILNGSGLAVGRTLLAIIENYQQEDGSFLIPTILIPYMNGLKEVK